MPAATEILKECFIPSCGISIQPSDAAITSDATPTTSLPKTSAIGSVKFVLKLEREILHLRLLHSKYFVPFTF